MTDKAKNRKYTPAQLAAVITFMACILAFFVLFLVLPKNTTELDKLEFRKLAQHPIKGVSAEVLSRQLVRGELSSNVDSYLEDHFPARSFFIAVNSYYSRLTGRNAVQTVVLGKNGRMFDQPAAYDEEQIDRNIASIDEFAEKYGLETELIVVPGSGVTVASELPAVHPNYRDEEIIARYKSKSSANVYELADFYAAAVKANAASEGELYYRTDHHWTMLGAYLCYCRICQELGADPVPQTEFTVEEYEFRGSYYRKSGAWLTEPDTLEVWRSPVLDNAEVVISPAKRLDMNELAAGIYESCVFDNALQPSEIAAFVLKYAFGVDTALIADTDEGKAAARYYASCSAETVICIEAVDNASAQKLLYEQLLPSLTAAAETYPEEEKKIASAYSAVSGNYVVVAIGADCSAASEFFSDTVEQAKKRTVTHKGVYDETKLAPDETNKYAAYLYDNNAVTVISNPEGNGESVMIVKDSYGNSIAPLFAQTYSTVVLIDTRYYPDPVDPGELVAQYGITKLLVIIGLDTATTLAGFAYLR